ncbi:hypothetical protein OAN307_c32210 [Octadecabacter antarcticus 307]|uniref:Uncharacterized protein n=1 Tax=Octadecabacter antarcticus 307 TaxID=391626 RepID=M9RFZ2_9RHOB|nr:hypothetical protein OAN307_c32210 [Octadecabacter antarcticus 307]
MAHSPRGYRRRDGLIAFFRAPPSEERLGHTHLSIHPLETAVLLGHVLHLGDQGRIHAAELGTPLVKTGAAHPMLSAQIRDRRTALRLLQNAHDLCVAKSRYLHQKSPQISC